MIFGDGISWENHVDEVLADEAKGRTIHHASPCEFLSEAVDFIRTDTPMQKRRALDCGCHIGRWTDVVTTLRLEYNGVDQSEKALNVAKKLRPNGKYHHSMLWDMKFNNEFDLAFCVAVLQHNKVDEQPKIVRKIFDALKPGGVFAFTESTLHRGTETQRTHQGWKDMAQVSGFRVMKTFHKNELGLEDMYICIKP